MPNITCFFLCLSVGLQPSAGVSPCVPSTAHLQHQTHLLLQTFAILFRALTEHFLELTRHRAIVVHATCLKCLAY